MTEETAFKKRPKRLGLHEKRLKEALELYYEEAEEFFADTAENLQKLVTLVDEYSEESSDFAKFDAISEILEELLEALRRKTR